MKNITFPDITICLIVFVRSLAAGAKFCVPGLKINNLVNFKQKKRRKKIQLPCFELICCLNSSFDTFS